MKSIGKRRKNCLAVLDSGNPKKTPQNRESEFVKLTAVREETTIPSMRGKRKGQGQGTEEKSRWVL